MLIYKSEIWPKNYLPPTKSDCIGFRITSDIPVVSYARKAKIQPQMAVSGYADIFSINVDSRLKTIVLPTGVATEINCSSVFL